ncbi:MAG TPA: glycoside hydrolase family 5 protein [Firmicutes bacterium]|nr:glycoside hydrolase family 5 protein [Bacillota bacterium]
MQTGKQAAAKGVSPLHIENLSIVNAEGQEVLLRGVSSHGMQWFGQYVNYDVLKWLRDDWKINVFRAAMMIDEGGYHQDPRIKDKLIEAIEAAIALDLYIVVDWHNTVGDPTPTLEEEIVFFQEIMEKYKQYPNLIYEIYNEPNGQDVRWENKIRPFAEKMVQAIRKTDPDHLILVGTATWSQDVHEAADHPLEDPNVMYVAHFYAGTHGQSIRDQVAYALQKGVPVMVTEWGVSTCSGGGGVYLEETKEWLQFMEENRMSWINWNISDKQESSAALLPGASDKGGWTEAELSASGKLIREYLRTGKIC